jgi:ABC-type phosphate transport system substrate-binding protein
MILGVAVAALSVGPAGAATVPLYGGGSTLVEKVYRDLFNNYGNTAGGDLCVGRPVCPTSHYDASTELLYVGVGSGNGLKALEGNDPSLYVTGGKTPDKVPVPSTRDFGPFYGTGKGKTWTPGTGTGPYFPKVSFSGSDDSLTQTDITNNQAGPLKNNPLIQIPGIVAAIAVPFDPAANWNPKGTKPSGGSSAVQLSTNTLCGIFTGKITAWNDAHITKDNGGTRLGTGKITVVYRHDGSGTTFIFSNALINQCGTPAHRTKSQYPVPTQWLNDNSITATTSAPYYRSNTSFFINVFNAHHLPANFINNETLTGVTGGASGSGGVRDAINGTTGSIGYVSPDFVQPIDSSGPNAANLQTYASFSAGSTPVYKAPTAANAIPIMAATKPPSFPNAAKNPLNWGPVNPTPAGAGTYPIGGFSFIDLHRCYKSSTDVAALVGTQAKHYGYLTWYYGASSVNQDQPTAILSKDGFASVPQVWKTAVLRLLTTAPTGVSVVGKNGCASVSHGA